MHTRTKVLSLLLVLMTAALAQNGQSNGNNNGNGPGNGNSQAGDNQRLQLTGNADKDWDTFKSLTKPTPGAATRNASGSLETRKASIRDQTNKARSVAQAAKDFYTQYPGHSHAAEARKIEAISMLHGVQDGDPAQEASAQAIAKAYRDDRKNSDTDRCEVALALERQKLSASTKARKVVLRTDEWEKMADALRGEFGDQPQLHEYYAELVRSGDMFAARRIAGNLLKWNSTPAAKTEAQAALDRYDLVGKPLALSVTSSDGAVIDLSQLKGATTVVFVWMAGAAAQHMDQLTRYKSSLPPGVNVLYLAMYGDQDKAKAAIASQPLPGSAAFVPAATSKVAVTVLKLRAYPYLYVVNAKGNLVGFGPVGELTNLLYLAAQP